MGLFMKLIYISPVGNKSPDLFNTFAQPFENYGIEIVEDVFEADIAFIDLFSYLRPMSDTALMAISRRISIVFWDESDYGGMSLERFNSSWVGDVVINQKVVYFMRKMSKGIIYPKYVFPYEKPMMNELPLTTSQELFSRPYDIFFYGNTSPPRKSVTDELSNHFKCDFSLGQQKISHEDWLNRARQSKLFLTSDGGGFSDERPYQLITISPMLRQKNNHLQVHPFSDCINCLEVSEHPTQEEIAGIKAVLNDPDYLYEIYTEGIFHLQSYYSAEFRAKYVLEIINKQINGIN